MSQANSAHHAFVADAPQPAAGQRLAAALGWDQAPELSDEELRQIDQELESGQAEVRRFYGPNDTDNAQ